MNWPTLWFFADSIEQVTLLPYGWTKLALTIILKKRITTIVFHSAIQVKTLHISGVGLVRFWEEMIIDSKIDIKFGSKSILLPSFFINVNSFYWIHFNSTEVFCKSCLLLSSTFQCYKLWWAWLWNRTAILLINLKPCFLLIQWYFNDWILSSRNLLLW